MSNPYLRGARRPRPVQNVGHRGAMGLAPENTLESFALAFELGATMLELDVHVTRDRRVVVIHDDTLDRTTDAVRRGARPGTHVSEVTLAELQALDAGRWFVDRVERGQLPPAPHGPTDDERRRHLGSGALARLASGTVRAPTLEDTLRLVKERDGLVNVELKMVPRRYPDLVAGVVDVVRRAGAQDRVLLSSFDHQALAHAKRLAPELPTAALVVARLHDAGRYVRDVLGGDAWNPGCVGEYDTLGFHAEERATRGDAALDRAAIEAAQALGVSVHVWTANDPATLRALVALGVDGIITDYPGRLAPLLAGG